MGTAAKVIAMIFRLENDVCLAALLTFSSSSVWAFHRKPCPPSFMVAHLVGAIASRLFGSFVASIDTPPN